MNKTELVRPEQLSLPRLPKAPVLAVTEPVTVPFFFTEVARSAAEFTASRRHEFLHSSYPLPQTSDAHAQSTSGVVDSKKAHASGGGGDGKKAHTQSASGGGGDGKKAHAQAASGGGGDTKRLPGTGAEGKKHDGKNARSTKKPSTAAAVESRRGPTADTSKREDDDRKTARSAPQTAPQPASHPKKKKRDDEGPAISYKAAEMEFANVRRLAREHELELERLAVERSLERLSYEFSRQHKMMLARESTLEHLQNETAANKKHLTLNDAKAEFAIRVAEKQKEEEALVAKARAEKRYTKTMELMKNRSEELKRERNRDVERLRSECADFDHDYQQICDRARELTLEKVRLQNQLREYTNMMKDLRADWKKRLKMQHDNHSHLLNEIQPMQAQVDSETQVVVDSKSKTIHPDRIQQEWMEQSRRDIAEKNVRILMVLTGEHDVDGVVNKFERRGMETKIWQDSTAEAEARVSQLKAELEKLREERREMEPKESLEAPERSEIENKNKELLVHSRQLEVTQRTFNRLDSFLFQTKRSLAWIQYKVLLMQSKVNKEPEPNGGESMHRAFTPTSDSSAPSSPNKSRPRSSRQPKTPSVVVEENSPVDGDGVHLRKEEAEILAELQPEKRNSEVFFSENEALLQTVETMESMLGETIAILDKNIPSWREQSVDPRGLAKYVEADAAFVATAARLVTAEKEFRDGVVNDDVDDDNFLEDWESDRRAFKEQFKKAKAPKKKLH